MMTFIIKTVISSLLTKSLNNCQKSQISQFSNYIFINGKSHYPVFFKILSAVTPEIVVVWLRRVNEYLWLFKRTYSQFIQNTFGNTGQQLGSIGISERTFCLLNFIGKFGTFPILFTQPCNSQDWARLSKMSIAMFFAIFCVIFFMNFNNSCGIQDLGLSESKNSIVALSLLSLLLVQEAKQAKCSGKSKKSAIFAKF